jgi:hypothetical protein
VYVFSSDADNTTEDLAFLYYQVHQFEPSPITHINDEETQTYLRKVGKQVASHDAHARYNKLFPNQAQTALGKGDVKGVAAFGIYRSPNTTYTFKVSNCHVCFLCKKHAHLHVL